MFLHKAPLLLAMMASALTVAACGSTDGTGGNGTGAFTDASNTDGTLNADGTAGDDATTANDTTAGTDAAIGVDGADTAAGTDATAGTDAASTDTGPNIDNLPCPSGQTYNGGTGNDMEPGNTCIQCHGQQGGPTYKIGGTVFRNLITETGCYASGKAGSVVPPATYTVEITDANAKVFKTTTSSLSGNFHMSSKSMSGFTPPYTARVLDAAGNARKMTTKQTSGDCNSCHTADGAQGAPGRIVAPDAP